MSYWRFLISFICYIVLIWLVTYTVVEYIISPKNLFQLLLFMIFAILFGIASASGKYIFYRMTCYERKLRC